MSSDNLFIEHYKHNYRKKYFLLLILFVLAVILSFYSLNTGTYHVSVYEVLKCFLGQGNKNDSIVIFNLRLPRIVSAVISGGGLAIAGLTIQRLLKNPLASPYTIGISQGAAFGAAFAIMFFGAGATLHFAFMPNLYTVTTFAFIGALISVLVIICLARFKHFSNESIILSGVALSALFSSATVLLQYFANEKELQYY